jgi:hypothetical protein
MTSIDRSICITGRSPSCPDGQDRLHVAKTVLENADLLRLIYGFGDATHRARMKEVFDEEGTYLSPIPKDYLPEYQERFKLFYKLVRCRCCSRHSHRKPWMKVRDGLLWCYKDYGPHVPEDADHHDCYCSCRHQARLLQWKIQLEITRQSLREEW